MIKEGIVPKLPLIITVSSLILASFFISFNITGNVIGNVTINNYLGVSFFIVGIVAAFLYFRNR
jgi:hypothetical protein